MWCCLTMKLFTEIHCRAQSWNVLVGLHGCPGLCSSKPSLPREVTWSFSLLMPTLGNTELQSPEFSLIQLVQILPCSTLEDAGSAYLYIKAQQASHEPQLLALSNVYAFVYRLWFPGWSLRNTNTLSKSVEYMGLSSLEMLPGLFRVLVLRTLGFPLMCLLAHPVLSISMCYLLAISYASIILLWMVICFAGQCLSPEISGFSHGP